MGDEAVFSRIKKQLGLGKQPNNSITTETDGPLSPNIDKVKERLNITFSECSDYVQREIVCGEDNDIKILVSYIEGLVDKKLLNQDVIRPILNYFSDTDRSGRAKSVYQLIKECIISNNEIHEIVNMSQAVYRIVSGDAVLF